MFETLVRLAALGTSGVCVLIVFWAGRTITKLSPDTPKPVFQLLRHYLLLCAFIAVVSALSGIALARYNEQQTRELLKVTDESERAFKALQSQADALSQQLKAASSATPPAPPKIERDVAKQLEKAANDVEHEAGRAAKDINKSTQWVKKRFGF